LIIDSFCPVFYNTERGNVLIVLIIISAVIGLLIASVPGCEVLGLGVGIAVFIVGLPGVLIGWLVGGCISSVQDREDDRQLMSDIAAWERADEHERAEDERNERLIEALEKRPKQILFDNRKQHIHLHDESGVRHSKRHSKKNPIV